jgi:ribonuclease P protein component
VLPAGARLRRREDFTLVVRRGRRAGRSTLVAHYLPPTAGLPAASPQVGFVVSRAVGGSVDRHRVVRRLRHLVRDRLGRLPAGARLVIRALPPAGDADSATLGVDLDAVLDRITGVPTPVPDRTSDQLAGTAGTAGERAVRDRAGDGPAAGEPRSASARGRGGHPPAGGAVAAAPRRRGAGPVGGESREPRSASARGGDPPAGTAGGRAVRRPAVDRRLVAGRPAGAGEADR